ncbi:MAG: SprT family zinc-dependent metalloprotease [Pseudomonadota bacterium]
MTSKKLVHLQAGLPENLIVKVSPRAKRMALRLDPQSRVMNLVVPKRARLENAYLFANEHKQWIYDRLAELPDPVPFEDGEKLPVFGMKRQIEVDYDPDLRKTDIELYSNELYVSTNKEDPSNRIKRFLKEEAKNHMTEMVHEKAAEIGGDVQSVTIRDTKSRWGSCSEDGKISLSWRLIFAPYEAMDYVVAHEVAHLVHMDHGDRFWDLCADLSEDFSTGVMWMKEHGHELMRYGVSEDAF